MFKSGANEGQYETPAAKPFSLYSILRLYKYDKLTARSCPPIFICFVVAIKKRLKYPFPFCEAIVLPLEVNGSEVQIGRAHV